ncbi:WXG100 family type VII secretion target [Rhodococcus sp. D2-41]|nr:WXG100 family type VII secretion target [Rhodococcus sp. D2-41]
MHATATRVSVLADELWDDVESLRREAEAVMTMDWTGEASDSHAALWQEWVESARAVIGALSGDATLIHRAADQYDAAEVTSASAISKLNMD